MGMAHLKTKANLMLRLFTFRRHVVAIQAEFHYQGDVCLDKAASQLYMQVFLYSGASQAAC